MTEPPSPEHVTSPRALPGELPQQSEDRLAAAEQREERLGPVVAELVQQVSILASEIADLDERLRTVQRLLTEQRTNLTQERSLAHLALGEEYTILVTQRFLNVAQQFAAPDRPESGLDTAQTVADLCRLLFDGITPRQQDVLDALGLNAHHPGALLVFQAAASASTLRERAKATLDHVMWDFAIEPGSPVNDRQSPWANCAPDLPAQFVVAPAFLVNGTPITRQLVYTSAQPPKLRPPALLGQPKTPQDPAPDPQAAERTATGPGGVTKSAWRLLVHRRTENSAVNGQHSQLSRQAHLGSTVGRGFWAADGMMVQVSGFRLAANRGTA